MKGHALDEFLGHKSEHAVSLFHHFTNEFKQMGKVTVLPAKTMIGIATPRKRIAYVTQLGKDFIHIVFPFDQAYQNNECFQKIAQVPGQRQFNHHLRMYSKSDVNDEVRRFMKLALDQGS